MTTRLYTPEDYPTVAGWWDEQGINRVAPEMLPKCGAIVESEAGPQAVGWLYMDNSVGVAFIGFPTVNPQALAELRGPVVAKVLIGALETLLLQFNYTVAVITTAQPPLAKLLKREGYATCHENVWEGMKVLV